MIETNLSCFPYFNGVIHRYRSSSTVKHSVSIIPKRGIERTQSISKQKGEMQKRRNSDDQKVTETGDALLYDYDVFLSFRGPDTRVGFTDFLYNHLTRAAGLRVFRDDDELNLGDKIERILLEIDNSRLCIPVFSKTFAQSKWCLWEVTRMVEMQKDILPIFYDVTVDDVKLETPLYNEFMPQHVTKSGEKEVEKWKEALKTIAALEGKQVSTLSLEDTAFFESFVKELLVKLKYRRIFDMDAPIGLESQVRNVMQRLDIDSGVVRYFGIFGMGGIGKTTLAKDIFNNIKDQFDGSCFLEDIRESFRRHGTTSLMRKLLNSLNILSSGGETDEDLSRLMGERFRRKKILIVFDDVDQWEQIGKLAGKSSWFGPGSRIIVTSRNGNVMKNRGDGNLSDGEISNFEMEPLGPDDALKLFYRHAFKEEFPPTGFKELSEKVVSLMGGLPLALKVIGSFLSKRKLRELWEEVIKKLKDIPEAEVKERLRLSYDALSDEQKQIYLDIACFFVGSSVMYPIYMWRDCQFHPSSGLEILRSMSLIKVSDDGIISMHDLLQDLGRDIVREEDFKIHANRSRLWEDEFARIVLMKRKDKPYVEAIRIEGDFSIDLTQRTKIGSLESLRYLDLQQTNLQGDFEDIFPDLIWLSYHCHIDFQGTTFAMTKLVILDFSSTNIDENWLGWSQLENAKNLKVLDLSQAEQLTRTPYFSEGLTLERLILNDCVKLVTIDGSIGHLKCLKSLSLKRCYSLTGLPDEVGHLEHLEYIVGDHSLISRRATSKNLDLRECSFIGTQKKPNLPKNVGGFQLCGNRSFSLPRSFGNLVKLKLLSLAEAPIAELPESFGELKSLIYLDLELTMISNLPDSIERLVELEQLGLGGCDQLKELPPTVGALKSLVALNLSRTDLVELPPSVGELPLLEYLNLSYCSLMKKLPDSVGTLTSLVELDLTSSGVLELPESIGGLENLKKLDLSACSNIKALPDTFGHLKRLVLLDLTRTGITELPESIGGLENLTDMRLIGCPLKMLPKSFGSLKKLEKLYAQYTDLSGGLPSEISGLSSLMFLNLSCSQVRELPSFINQLHHLQELLLFECNQLLELPDLPTNLMELRVKSASLHRVHQLSNLQSLKKLTLVSSQLASSESVFEIWKLSQLVQLDLILPNNTTLPDEFGNLTRLKTLELGWSNLTSVPRLPLSLEEMCLLNVRQAPDLSNLPDLKNLSILHVSVFCIGQLGISLPKCLSELHFRNCPNMESCPDISHLKILRTLHVEDCQSLTDIPGLGKLKSLEYLVIERCHSLTKLENLAELKQIQCIRIDACKKLSYPEGVDRSKVNILGGELEEISEPATNEQYDILSLLSSPGRDDFLIRGDGHQVKVDYLKGKKVCLYLHRMWVTFAHLLMSVYREWQARGDYCVVVRVPYDSDDENIINEKFSSMDWLAISISDWDRRRRLLQLFKRSVAPEVLDPNESPPQLVIFDESGRLLTTEGFEIIGLYNSLAYPFTPERIHRLKSVDECFQEDQSIKLLFFYPFSIEFVLTLDRNVLPVSELEGKVVGVYFSSSSYQCIEMTRTLLEVYRELKVNRESFEIVWAPSVNHVDSFREICSKLGHTRERFWLALCFRLFFYFNVSALPTLVIIGEDGKTVQPNAVEAIKRYGVRAYPFTPEKIEKAKKEECERLVSGCAEFVITKRGERVDAPILAGKNIILYFSARWGSGGCVFLPTLLEAYKGIRARDYAFEVIFISRDTDEASFRECFSVMPWLALPFGDVRISLLNDMLEVTEIPTLVAIGPTLEIIRKDVRQLITAYGSDAYPFTNDHISNIMVGSWPHKLQHARLHAHELALTDERDYRCNACYYQLGMPLWSYCCKECDFDLHPKCAFKGSSWGSWEEHGTRWEDMVIRDTLGKIIDSVRVSACRQFSTTSGEHQLHVSDLLGKNILLYFSAGWSSCSCDFMPKLLEAYNEIKARDYAFEVIFISYDKDEASFQECFSAMPWLALPFGDTRIPILYSMLEIIGIPILVAIGPTDRIIRKDVRDLIVAYGSDAYPFTDEHISNMVKNWPRQLYHAQLHPHELTLTERNYVCDACNYQLGVPLWSYYCKECDFDVHPKCAFKEGGHESPEQSEPCVGSTTLLQGECSRSSAK